MVVHREYSLSYNETHEQAEWVAYVLTADEVRMKCERTNDFREDGSVSTGSAGLADYRGSGYDRGHLSPAADNKADCPVAMSESFYMSNMSPQKPGFNRGIWRKLESKVRDWAAKYGEIYVATGPVFWDIIEKIGAN
ncbi:MAG: DNA/RNA non-specific endonuclease, partial [Ignavibacteria bacterium]|nr:DNA/RNA non-specific endonuclease [Ignavibacteria bacterium]